MPKTSAPKPSMKPSGSTPKRRIATNARKPTNASLMLRRNVSPALAVTFASKIDRYYPSPRKGHEGTGIARNTLVRWVEAGDLKVLAK